MCVTDFRERGLSPPSPSVTNKFLLVTVTKFLAISLKQLLNVSATTWSSKKSGLTVFQNFLLSVTELMLILAKYIRDLHSNFFGYHMQFLSQHFSLSCIYYAI